MKTRRITRYFEGSNVFITWIFTKFPTWVRSKYGSLMPIDKKGGVILTNLRRIEPDKVYNDGCIPPPKVLKKPYKKRRRILKIKDIFKIRDLTFKLVALKSRLLVEKMILYGEDLEPESVTPQKKKKEKGWKEISKDKAIKK